MTKKWGMEEREKKESREGEGKGRNGEFPSPSSPVHRVHIGHAWPLVWETDFLVTEFHLSPQMRKCLTPAGSTLKPSIRNSLCPVPLFLMLLTVICRTN